MADIPCLLLAAGSSSRMGRAKQLLPWGEGTLIEHQVQTLLKTGHPVVVVLGYKADQIQPIIDKFRLKICINKHWEKGMGSSIAHGIRYLDKEFPGAAGVLISQLDQPLLTCSHFEKMLQAYCPGSRQIIVSQSPAGWRGVPVLFDRIYFDELQNLSGDEGARKIVQSHAQTLQILDAGDILEDMDSPGAYQKLLSKYKRLS